MKPLSVVIVDDDDSSRYLLKNFISYFADYEYAGEASSGLEFIDLVLDIKPDIALVDIQMSGLSGMEAVRECLKSQPTLQVIFTTGYEEFAVEAFNIAAADYLIKPIQRHKLLSALEKGKNSLEGLRNKKRGQSSRDQYRKLSVRSYNTHLYLLFEDILFVEKEDKKTMLHTKDEVFETTESLQEIESRLPDYFFKTHRSFLVNLRSIVRIEPMGETYLAYLSNTKKVAYISKLKIQEVRALLTS
ncbi:LytR/AlgR family response regulator transcription factor [Heyndrickxia acidicola]|uniref:LytTR family DNA-binding domain-containing protein n=1 Tax=Heyndrickxia acidicola TaxID=209389 RepID=A0ABU6MP17_9BACI|nr:LytTR family DNA-binding domain-containing protein [Heyndrickxia acidicola]MED1205731.1 LytTR family DNA-binding domain-containing protein [Heyndrickxia acidicola]